MVRNRRTSCSVVVGFEMIYKLLDDGKIDDNDTKSEYERGFIDCWNRYCYCPPGYIKGWKENFPDIFY